MKSLSRFSGCFLTLALAAGTLADKPHTPPPLTLGGYRVLAGDFHVHEYPWSAGALAPWDLPGEARRQGLDIIAVTGHNEVIGGRIARWFSHGSATPLVLAGEEIHTPGYHMVAVGIHSPISWRGTAAQSAAEVHRQGGIAIAAHPLATSWPDWNPEAMRLLDGAEVRQPVVYGYPIGAEEMRLFFERTPLAAIGSSDYHGMGPLGAFRTYVFASAHTEAAVLDALRQHRTVVYGASSRLFGDPAMIRLAQQYGDLRRREPITPGRGFLDWLSRICAVIGLGGVIFGAFRGVYSAEDKEFTQT